MPQKLAVSGNCEEELPKKPVGRLSVNCRPTGYRQSADKRPTNGRQSADRFFGELFFTITLSVLQRTPLYHYLHIVFPPLQQQMPSKESTTSIE